MLSWFCIQTSIFHRLSIGVRIVTFCESEDIVIGDTMSIIK